MSSELEDFSDVETPSFDMTSSPQPTQAQVRFSYMRVGIFLAAGCSLLAMLFSFWAMIDKRHNPAIGSFLFGTVSFALQVLFLLSIWLWKWFDLVTLN